MPFKSPTPCKCGRRVVKHGKCQQCLAKARRQDDRIRGNATERGYGREHQERFRLGVLERDHWTCQKCSAAATVADHYPRTRRQLIADGADPNDPRWGRALCKTCHDQHTLTGTRADLRARRLR